MFLWGIFTIIHLTPSFLPRILAASALSYGKSFFKGNEKPTWKIGFS